MVEPSPVDRLEKFFHNLLHYALAVMVAAFVATAVFLLFIESLERLHFYRLIGLVWRESLTALSQTNLSFIAYSIGSPVAAFVVAFSLLRKWRSQADAMEQLKDSTIWAAVGLAVPLVIVLLTFAWHFPKAIYEDHQTLAHNLNASASQNRNLYAEVEWRKQSLAVTDPVFWNMTRTLMLFSELRQSLKGEPCILHFTAPNDVGGVYDIFYTLGTSSGCSVVGMGFGNPDDQTKEITEGIVPETIIVHFSEDDKAARGFADQLATLVKIRQSYNLPTPDHYMPSVPPAKGKNIPLHIIWFQFGSNTKWNTQLLQAKAR